MSLSSPSCHSAVSEEPPLQCVYLGIIRVASDAIDNSEVLDHAICKVKAAALVGPRDVSNAIRTSSQPGDADVM